MKHLGIRESEYFIELLREIELDLDDEAIRLMIGHLEWVLEWNKRINLTSIVDPSEAVRLHLIDSLTAVPSVAACQAGPACDLGSGAGFPGVPLSVATARPFMIVESVGKKAAVIQAFVDSERRALASQISVKPVRAEELANTHRESYAVVTARAVSQLGALIELASPLLSVGGSLIALKGNVADPEWEYARRVAGLTGMSIERIEELRLPGMGEARTIVTATKVGSAAVQLPRRIGLAQKSPLA